MIKRYNSLYFGSIGIRESLVVLASLFKIFQNHKKIEKKLHSKICHIFSAPKCFTYSSARGALADFLISINLQKEDEVILTSFTCLAVPTAIIASGAKPVYCDISYETMNQTLESIKLCVSEKTKVIIVQHTMGNPVDIDNILSYAKTKGIIVIEDCALSIGTKMNDKFLGTYGDASIFSLELSKTVSSGWGGLLIVNNEKMVHSISVNYNNHTSLSFLKNYRMIFQTFLCGIIYHPKIYFLGKYLYWFMYKINFFKSSTPQSEHYGIISNDFISKLGRPQAYLALSQFKKIDSIFKSCNKNFNLVSSILRKYGFTVLNVQYDSVFTVSSRVPFLINDQSKAVNWFQKHGVELGLWFNGPLSPWPKNEIFKYENDLYPKSVKLSNNIINFPCHSKINKKDIKKFDSLIKEYIYHNPESNNI